MRRRHAVTLGMGVAAATTLAVLSGCGESTFGTCQDTNSCLDASVDATGAGDQFAGDSTGEDTGSGEGGPGAEGGEGGVVDDAGCSAPTTLDCSGTCVDPTLPANCGSCGNSCVGPEAGPGYPVCQPGGLCAVACASDGGDGGAAEILCTGACVSPDDVSHCGTCTNTCAAPPSGNGAPTCPAAQCVMTCISGYHPAGAGCNTDCLANTDDPSVDPCVVTDGSGAFVSPTGDDTTGDGTKEHPYGSIGHAMDTSARVYACGTFTGEQLVVSGTTRDGTSVYGGFDCATWTYTAGTTTNLAPTAAGFALQVNGLTKGVTFEDFAFDSVPAITPGGSSEAVLVYASQNVTFRRCAMTAGSASVTGAGGVSGTNTWSGIAATGNSASGQDGALELTTCTCGGTGGNGGNAGTDNGHGVVTQAGGPGGAGTSGLLGSGGPGAEQGLVGAVPVVVPCGAGTAGSAGPPGVAGAGANSMGALSVTGWSNPGGSGAPGQMGGAAQGGGGGGGATYNPSTTTPTGGGGGGACGGCGGAGAASGGSPGGSSIALVVVTSTVAVDTCTLTAAAGGVGGQGGGGLAGQSGGPPGAQAASGCTGAAGGTGGTGGAGGGGTGGHSIGIAYSGTAPTQVGTVTISVATTAALGGAPGTGISSAASYGATGLNVATQSF